MESESNTPCLWLIGIMINTIWRGNRQISMILRGRGVFILVSVRQTDRKTFAFATETLLIYRFKWTDKDVLGQKAWDPTVSQLWILWTKWHWGKRLKLLIEQKSFKLWSLGTTRGQMVQIGSYLVTVDN